MIEETYVEVNGKKIKIRPGKSRFTRTAYQITQDILKSFRRVGIEEEHLEILQPRNILHSQKSAEIKWYVNGENFYYKADRQDRYVDNLGVISKVIEQDVYAICNGMKSFGQVMNQFRLGYDPEGKKILNPRQILGIPNDIKDLDYITFKYKQLAKEAHPDRGGSKERFQEINEAYKILKEELSK